MRVLLLGSDNPHSDDPKMALHPSAFPGSAGSRLYAMLLEFYPVREEEYLDLFDRANLSDFPSYAQERLDVLRGYDFVVMLGSLVPVNLRVGLKRGVEFYLEDNHDRFRYVVIPHPSGLSRVYNDRHYRWRTASLLNSLAIKVRASRS